MTLQAISIAAMECPGVWQTMAVLASRNTGMESFMAVGAIYPDMIGFCICKIVRLFFVAGAAECCRDIAGRRYFHWLMGRMATQTVCHNLLLQMWLVTFQTTGNLFVSIVAAVAEELGMTTGRGGHLLTDLGMTGQAGCLFGVERVA